MSSCPPAGPGTGGSGRRRSPTPSSERWGDGPRGRPTSVATSSSPYSVGTGRTYSHVLLPYLDERVEASFAGRIGTPGNLTLVGIGLSRETLDLGGFPGNLEIARNSDFGAPEPAPDSLIGVVAPQAQEHVHGPRGRAPGSAEPPLRAGSRPRPSRRRAGYPPRDRRGRDGGPQHQCSVGLGPPLIQRHLRQRALLPGSAPRNVVHLPQRGRGWAQRPPAVPNGSGWHDVIGEVDLYSYLQVWRHAPSDHLRAPLRGGRMVACRTPFQLTPGRAILGTRLPRRGLPRSPEDHRHRWRTGSSCPGPPRTSWTSGSRSSPTPGACGGETHPSARRRDGRRPSGGGIRLGFPPGSRRRGADGPGFPPPRHGAPVPVFRVTLYELLGLNAGFADPQLERSRRLAVGPDYFTQEGR